MEHNPSQNKSVPLTLYIHGKPVFEQEISFERSTYEKMKLNWSKVVGVGKRRRGRPPKSLAPPPKRAKYDQSNFSRPNPQQNTRTRSKRMILEDDEEDNDSPDESDSDNNSEAK